MANGAKQRKSSPFSFEQRVRGTRSFLFLFSPFEHPPEAIFVDSLQWHSLLANDTRSNNFLARDTPTKDTKSLAAIKSARALSFNCENLVKPRQPIDNRASKIEVDPSAFSETNNE